MSNTIVARRRRQLVSFGSTQKVVLLALTTLFLDVAHAASPSLTVAEAQRLAVARSRQLPAHDLAIAASRESAIAAGQLPDPVIKAGIDNLPVSGADRFSLGADFMTMKRIGVMQEWTRSDKLQLRAERFEQEAEKTAASKSVTLSAIQRDTALAWFDLYYLNAMANIATEQSSQATLEIQAAEGAYRAGRGSQSDLLTARAAMVSVDDRMSEIRRRVSNARTMLARWIGGAEPVLAEPPAIDTIRLQPDKLETQLNHHPELAVLGGQEAIARTDAKLARANKTGDWNVEVALQQRGPGYSNMISIGVAIPLQWNQKNRQDRELSSKLALVEQVKAEREEMLRAHVAETRAMIAEWENNRERSARYQNELVPLAGQRILATVAAYRGGKATLAELLVARRNEIDVRIQAVQLQWDTARLWAQLNFLYPDESLLADRSSSARKDLP